MKRGEDKRGWRWVGAPGVELQAASGGGEVTRGGEAAMSRMESQGRVKPGCCRRVGARTGQPSEP